MKRSTTNHFKQYLSRALILVALVGVALLPLAPASAESLNDKIANLQSQIDSAQAEANRLQGEADTLQNALSILASEKNALQMQIDLSQAKYDQLTAKIEENQKKLEKQQRVLSSTVSDISVESSTSPIELLAGSPSIGDFIDRQEYRTSVQEQIENAISIVKKLKLELSEQRKEVEVVLAEQTVQRDQLAAKEQEQQRLLAATQAKESEYHAHIGNLKEQQAEAQAILAASISSGSYRVAPAGYVQAGDVVGGVGSTGLSTGPHLHLEVRAGGSGCNITADPANYMQQQPVNPAVVTQHYHNSDGLYRCGFHPGTDYGASNGSPIFAIAPGMMYRGCSAQLLGTDAYGYVAIVEMGNGAIAIYAHMSGGPAACSYNTWYN